MKAALQLVPGPGGSTGPDGGADVSFGKVACMHAGLCLNLAVNLHITSSLTTRYGMAAEVLHNCALPAHQHGVRGACIADCGLEATVTPGYSSHVWAV